MSHKLTKEVKKRLAEYGAKITTPGYVPGVPTAITAAEIKASGRTTDRAGKPVDAKQSYYLAAPPAVNHTRRLESAYVAGGWPAVEVYLQPFMTPEYAAKQLAARAAGADEALHPMAAELQPFEALPLTSADEVQTELRTCEPRPLAEQQQAAADEFRQVVDEHRAAGTLPAAPAVLYARPYDEGTVLPEDEASTEHLVHQLYEAGHPGPMPAAECPDARQCAGTCGVCLNN